MGLGVGVCRVGVGGEVRSHKPQLDEEKDEPTGIRTWGWLLTSHVPYRTTKAAQRLLFVLARDS